LEAMRARRARRALSIWRRYSASTSGAAIAGGEERTLEIGGDGGARCVWVRRAVAAGAAGMGRRRRDNASQRLAPPRRRVVVCRLWVLLASTLHVYHQAEVWGPPFLSVLSILVTISRIFRFSQLNSRVVFL
jgi:hypothetical protein